MKTEKFRTLLDVENFYVNAVNERLEAAAGKVLLKKRKRFQVLPPLFGGRTEFVQDALNWYLADERIEDLMPLSEIKDYYHTGGGESNNVALNMMLTRRDFPFFFNPVKNSSYYNVRHPRFELILPYFREVRQMMLSHRLALLPCKVKITKSYYGGAGKDVDEALNNVTYGFSEDSFYEYNGSALLPFKVYTYYGSRDGRNWAIDFNTDSLKIDEIFLPAGEQEDIELYCVAIPANTYDWEGLYNFNSIYYDDCIRYFSFSRDESILISDQPPDASFPGVRQNGTRHAFRIAVLIFYRPKFKVLSEEDEYDGEGEL